MCLWTWADAVWSLCRDRISHNEDARGMCQCCTRHCARCYESGSSLTCEGCIVQTRKHSTCVVITHCSYAMSELQSRQCSTATTSRHAMLLHRLTEYDQLSLWNSIMIIIIITIIIIINSSSDYVTSDANKVARDAEDGLCGYMITRVYLIMPWLHHHYM